MYYKELTQVIIEAEKTLQFTHVSRWSRKASYLNSSAIAKATKLEANDSSPSSEN